MSLCSFESILTITTGGRAEGTYFEYDVDPAILVEGLNTIAVEVHQANLTSSDLELTEDSGIQLVGVRFNDIKLTCDAVVRQAYIQFTCDEPSIKPASLIIAAEATGHAERFSSDSHDLSSRTLTETEVGWNPRPWLLVGASAAAQRTPDLAPIIESVIRGEDWQPGNSIALLISGSGKRVASAYRGRRGKPAKLIVLAEQDGADLSATPLAQRYRLRMLFGLPRSDDGVEPVFDVYAQEKRVLADVKLSSTAAGGARYAVKVIEDIPITTELKLRLVPKQGQPVLSGIELVRQAGQESE